MIERERLIALVAVVCLVIGFGGGVGVDRYVFFGGAAPTEPANAQPVFGVFWQAWRLVEDHYVDPGSASPEKLTQGAISGMLNALGDTGHTRYLTPTDRRQEANDLAGRLEGIGIEVEERDQGITIVAPLDNSPAQKAGLKPGDVIVKVDGKDVANETLDEASHLIRGPTGTSVKLTILRPGAAELLDFTITRQEVSVPDVTWATIPGTKIAHIRISSFGQNTDQQLRQAIQESRAAGDTAIVLDLRNDPGGLLDQAVQVASEFLTSGNVLFEQDRSGKRTPQPVRPGGVEPNAPMVVLVNHGTASAAEIVSGALQDQRRARIVGEQTFGTGTVLQEYALSDGSSILLGVREWLTPNGHFIRPNGITPDKVVAEPASSLTLVPAEERSMTVAEFQKDDDRQLEQAIAMLQHP
ncbi:MAG TPA: S41 family peptidase [Chloroflexota bacterium]|nr:S41 family peptidase [Chloroflexota bacterium]